MSKQFAILLGAVLTLASAQPVIPYDSLMDARVGIDGVIDNEEGREYPATYSDKASGLTVNWGFDDSLVYVGLVTKGRGWLAIGFGSPTMNESNMIIGYYTEDSTEVTNQVGAQHVHAGAPQSDSAMRVRLRATLVGERDTQRLRQLSAGAVRDAYQMLFHDSLQAEIDYDDETGVTTMEFAYPLRFPAGAALAVPGLAPGGTYDVILAQNTKSVSLNAKHTNFSALKVKLADKPQPTKQE